MAVPTSGDLESKYEMTFQAFEIRPGVMMKVQKNANGQVSEIRVERFSETDSTVWLARKIDANMVKAIIDELSPIAERGAEGEFFGFPFRLGQSWTAGYNYEFVSINLIGTTDLCKLDQNQTETRTKRNRNNPFQSAEVIIIKWKDR